MDVPDLGMGRSVAPLRKLMFNCRTGLPGSRGTAFDCLRPRNSQPGDGRACSVQTAPPHAGGFHCRRVFMHFSRNLFDGSGSPRPGSKRSSKSKIQVHPSRQLSLPKSAIPELRTPTQKCRGDACSARAPCGSSCSLMGATAREAGSTSRRFPRGGCIQRLLA